MSRNPHASLMKGAPFRPGKGMVGLALAAAGVGVVALSAWSSVFSVEGGHAAIKFSRISGVLPKVHNEGWHLMIPWIHRPIIYNIRTRATAIPTLTGSKDLQMISLTVRVLSHPDKAHLPKIYSKLGMDFDSRVLLSIVNEVTKSVVADYNASALVTQRDRVSKSIKERLTQRAEDFYIKIDDVSIPQLGFGKEYTAAVEAKQVAAQEAERAKFIVEIAEQDKRSTIIKAEADAESARLLNEAMQENPYFLELRRIEAARDISRVLANSNNKMYLNSENLMFNLLESIQSQTKEDDKFAEDAKNKK
eukprot:TRINITY_DN2197_c0_g1_i1.p1 TRINITY_DN2197_c0_g1~~TRINITY_DN2197_c0_g1_i1.p1  ORF type:complete len:306 (+),score=60.73 TRINITY_DN2197_c0_g1_i1:53-970(+)